MSKGTKPPILRIGLVVGALLGSFLTPRVLPAAAQQLSARAPADSSSVVAGHGPRGFFVGTSDERWLMELQFRLQFRLSYPYDTDPVTFDDFQGPDRTSLEVNRARLKVGGNGFRPWLKYYFEYELASSNLLNFEVKVERYRQASLRVGQWKAQYSRERAISSGRQQLMDRSIINRAFTLDRQQGISLYGRLGEGLTDLNYWLSAFTGMGRGGGTNDDEHLMYMGRMQWNPLGRAVGFAGSDLSRSEDPALSLAAAGVTNRSSCTRFSGAGCGQLEGFDDGEPGQYRVNQILLESAFLWRGFSWAQEFHVKEIRDRSNDSTTTLQGFYAQAGYFPESLLSWMPAPLEIAARYGRYSPDRDQSDNRHEEFSLAVNWFFSGHDNKLTAEFSWLTVEDGVSEVEQGGRVRLQWDVQF
jgi:phosphate-selective porin